MIVVADVAFVTFCKNLCVFGVVFPTEKRNLCFLCSLLLNPLFAQTKSREVATTAPPGSGGDEGIATVTGQRSNKVVMFTGARPGLTTSDVLSA